MSKYTIAPIAAAVAILVSSPLLAEEVNPFTGAHGYVEELKLEVEKTHQKNQLLKEKAELARNQFMLDNIQSQLTTEMRVAMDKLDPPKSKASEEMKSVSMPAMPVVTPPAPPKPKMKLASVIETASGRQAIVTKGEITWNVVQGDKIGRVKVRRIFSNRIVLSNGKILRITNGEHPVSIGQQPPVEGGVRDNPSAIMGMTPPLSQQLPIGSSATPARF